MKFHAPDLKTLRRTVKPGDFLKVCAPGVPGQSCGERFWLEVENVSGDTVFGTVSNDLINHPLKFGDSINVNLDEVYQHISERPR
jgi:hypothetical protein